MTGESAPRKPLRVWPGVAIVILYLLAKYALPFIDRELMVVGLFGGIVGALAIVLWWLLFSRAAWAERLGAVALMAAATFGTWRLLDKSIATGAMGMLFPVMAAPILGMAFVAWAVATRHLPDPVRRATMVATILLASLGWTLIRTGGFTAATFDNDFHWRWTKSPEEKLLAQGGDEPAPAPMPVPLASAPAAEKPAAPAVPAAAPPRKEPRVTTASDKGTPPAPPRPAPETAPSEPEWPGFRGPHRDSIVAGVRIKTDWSASPPVEAWRRPIGPGWSSFAVHGDRLFTQEQRGEDEVVACYEASTGKPVWKHRDPARFWESNAGAGPRATPTLSDGRVYTLGATGIVNVLDEGSGAVVWSRNAGSDTGVKVPGWGFAASPLVVGGDVVVATAGSLVAYDRATGDRRWVGPKGGDGYSSPHLMTINGVPQVLLLNGTGAMSVAPADGTVLWEHALPSGTRIVQPAATGDGDVLVSFGEFGNGNGVRRIAVTRGAAGWTTRERWTSSGLKPNFNDFVVHKGHAYGFDGSILACIDLADGQRKWKGGRYGNGQLVLLPDQDLLLILAEEGELALVKATPDQFTELARLPALEGKTWNHPVVVGDRLLIRNDHEMAAFRLTLASR